MRLHNIRIFLATILLLPRLTLKQRICERSASHGLKVISSTACREIGTDLLGTDLAATSVCSIVSAVPLCLAHSVLTGAKRWFTPRAYGLCALQVGAFYAVAFGTIDALEKLHQ